MCCQSRIHGKEAGREVQRTMSPTDARQFILSTWFPWAESEESSAELFLAMALQIFSLSTHSSHVLILAGIRSRKRGKYETLYGVRQSSMALMQKNIGGRTRQGSCQPSIGTILDVVTMSSTPSRLVSYYNPWFALDVRSFGNCSILCASSSSPAPFFVPHNGDTGSQQARGGIHVQQLPRLHRRRMPHEIAKTSRYRRPESDTSRLQQVTHRLRAHTIRTTGSRSGCLPRQAREMRSCGVTSPTPELKVFASSLC